MGHYFYLEDLPRSIWKLFSPYFLGSAGLWTMSNHHTFACLRNSMVASTVSPWCVYLNLWSITSTRAGQFCFEWDRFHNSPVTYHFAAISLISSLIMFSEVIHVASYTFGGILFTVLKHTLPFTLYSICSSYLQAVEFSFCFGSRTALNLNAWSWSLQYWI